MQDIILIPGSWFKKPFRKAAAIHVSLHGQVFMGPSNPPQPTPTHSHREHPIRGCLGLGQWPAGHKYSCVNTLAANAAAQEFVFYQHHSHRVVKDSQYLREVYTYKHVCACVFVCVCVRRCVCVCKWVLAEANRTCDGMVVVVVGATRGFCTRVVDSVRVWVYLHAKKIRHGIGNYKINRFSIQVIKGAL